MVASLDYSEIISLSLNPVRVVALSDDSAAFLLACSAFYQSRFNWRVAAMPPSDSEWNDINRLIGKAENELMLGLVGLIVPHVLANLSGYPLLPCDGATYNRVDYPRLYAAIDASLVIDADTFNVPDLRDKFPLGDGLLHSVSESGGEDEHTLDISEMPSHTHTNTPHSHSEITALPSLADFGTGAPVPSATPSVSSTGLASVSIDSTGGGMPHNNMPPFYVVKYAIVAG